MVKESLKLKDTVIKSEQLEAIYNISKGFDTLCILPTGFGKSLIYQLIPSVFQKFKVPNPVVNILSPLLLLVADQVNAANNSGLGVHASALESQNFSDISVGKYNVELIRE